MILTFEVVDSSCNYYYGALVQSVREFVFSVTFFEVACLSSFSEDISSTKSRFPKKMTRGGSTTGRENLYLSTQVAGYIQISGKGRCGNGAEMQVPMYYIKLLLRAEMLLKINICRISSFKARSSMGICLILPNSTTNLLFTLNWNPNSQLVQTESSIIINVICKIRQRLKNTTNTYFHLSSQEEVEVSHLRKEIS